MVRALAIIGVWLLIIGWNILFARKNRHYDNNCLTAIMMIVYGGASMIVGIVVTILLAITL